MMNAGRSLKHKHPFQFRAYKGAGTTHLPDRSVLPSLLPGDTVKSMSVGARGSVNSLARGSPSRAAALPVLVQHTTAGHCDVGLAIRWAQEAPTHAATSPGRIRRSGESALLQ